MGCAPQLKSSRSASGTLIPPDPVEIVERGADAGNGLVLLLGQVQHRRLPFVGFAMAIRKGKTAGTTVAVSRDVRPTGKARPADLQPAVVDGAGIFTAKDEGHARGRAGKICELIIRPQTIAIG